MSKQKSKIILKEERFFVKSMKDVEDLVTSKNYRLGKSFIFYNCQECGKEQCLHLNTASKKQNGLLCHECEIIHKKYELHGGKEGYKKHVVEQIKKVMEEKYGVSNPTYLPDHVEKTKATKKRKYGNENYNGDPEQRKETCRKRYGVDNPFQDVEKIKKIKEKKYGDPFYTNRKGCWEKFNSKYPKGSKERYEFYKKSKENFEKKYPRGSKERTEYYKEVHKKTIQTNLKRYGVESPMQRENIRLHGFSPYRYDYNGYVFDSSWELAYYIWLLDQGLIDGEDFVVKPFPIDYYDNFLSKNRKYFPDFTVYDEIIEIKGPHLLKENGELKDSGKQQVMDELEVMVIDQTEIKPYLKYVEDKFGDKNWSKRFRKERSSGKR